jgi:hypothetical protein
MILSTSIWVSQRLSATNISSLTGLLFADDYNANANAVIAFPFTPSLPFPLCRHCLSLYAVIASEAKQSVTGKAKSRRDDTLLAFFAMTALDKHLRASAHFQLSIFNFQLIRASAHFQLSTFNFQLKKLFRSLFYKDNTQYSINNIWRPCRPCRRKTSIDSKNLRHLKQHNKRKSNRQSQ